MKSGWERTTLGEIAEIVSGATPSTSVKGYWDGDIRWVTPKDLSSLDGSLIATTARTITDAGLRSCAASVLPSNSVLLSSRAPIGLVAINAVPMATNQGFKSLVPDHRRVDSRFLYWWLRKNRPMLESLGNGATFKELSKKSTASVPISLPPIEEQRRIAAVLDAADALRAERRQALAKLDTLTQAIFIDMFGDLANNPRGWPLRRVADVVEGFETGRSIAAGEEEGGRFRVLKVSAVTSLRYRSSESKPVPANYAPPKAHLVRPGDLLMSRANTTELVGACAFVYSTPPNLLLPDKLWRFVWKEPREVEPLFIWKALQNARARREVGDLATGSSGSMKNISQEKFLGLELPVPPLEIQSEFVSRFLEVERSHDVATKQMESLDALFASLQHRAFRGEL